MHYDSQIDNPPVSLRLTPSFTQGGLFTKASPINTFIYNKQLTPLGVGCFYVSFYSFTLNEKTNTAANIPINKTVMPEKREMWS